MEFVNFNTASHFITVLMIIFCFPLPTPVAFFFQHHMHLLPYRGDQQIIVNCLCALVGKGCEVAKAQDSTAVFLCLMLKEI